MAFGGVLTEYERQRRARQLIAQATANRDGQAGQWAGAASGEQRPWYWPASDPRAAGPRVLNSGAGDPVLDRGAWKPPTREQTQAVRASTPGSIYSPPPNRGGQLVGPGMSAAPAPDAEADQERRAAVVQFQHQRRLAEARAKQTAAAQAPTAPAAPQTPEELRSGLTRMDETLLGRLRELDHSISKEADPDRRASLAAERSEIAGKRGIVTRRLGMMSDGAAARPKVLEPKQNRDNRRTLAEQAIAELDRQIAEMSRSPTAEDYRRGERDAGRRQLYDAGRPDLVRGGPNQANADEFAEFLGRGAQVGPSEKDRHDWLVQAMGRRQDWRMLHEALGAPEGTPGYARTYMEAEKATEGQRRALERWEREQARRLADAETETSGLGQPGHAEKMRAMGDEFRETAGRAAIAAAKNPGGEDAEVAGLRKQYEKLALQWGIKEIQDKIAGGGIDKDTTDLAAMTIKLGAELAGRIPGPDKKRRVDAFRGLVFELQDEYAKLNPAGQKALRNQVRMGLLDLTEGTATDAVLGVWNAIFSGIDAAVRGPKATNREVVDNFGRAQTVDEMIERLVNLTQPETTPAE